MKTLARSILVNIAYHALANGIRLPHSKLVRDFNQWSSLIDLTHQLGINVFVDVGANRGFFSKHLRMSGYQGRLLSFEPIPDDHDRIKVLAANDPHWTAYCYALGAENAVRDFYVNFCGDQTVMSSFLPMKGQTSDTQKLRAEVRRLDEVLPPLIKEIEAPRIFLKMDTQGFDSEVITGASGCLHQIMGIQSEISVIPLYEDMPQYTDSLAHYTRLGFALVDLFVVNRRDKFVIEYDALMARPDELKCEHH